MRPEPRGRRTLGPALATLSAVLGLTGPAAGQSPLPPRFEVSANLGGQWLSNPRTDAVDFEIFAERGGFQTTQAAGPGTVVDAGGSMRLGRWFGMGVTVAYGESSSNGTITATIPHPFFFDFHRATQGTAPGLAHRELGVHVQGQVWFELTPVLHVRVAAGPTYFDATQELVSAIATREVGSPFDTVNIASYETRRVAVNDIGYHVEVDLRYAWFGRVGLGVVTRFSRADPQVTLAGVTQPSLRVGGLQTAAGVRLGF